MTGFDHETVLQSEVVHLLEPRQGAVILDGTLGGGGHSEALLERGAQVIGTDRDPRAVAAAKARLARFGEAFRAVRADFRDAEGVLRSLGIDRVDGALVDLGVSSPQLDVGERGFSFSRPGPLDMRMSGEGETLAELLERVDVRELTRILREYGEEPFARPIARAIRQAVEKHGARSLDTAGLAELVAHAIPRKAWPRSIHPATRTFQALRIAVNDELGNLREALNGGIARLRAGGRFSVISFHSLEDRIVKHAFRAAAKGCDCPPDLPVCRCGGKPTLALITRRPLVPSDEETRTNPRARSAKLRTAQRI